MILNDQKASDKDQRLGPWSIPASSKPLLDIPMTKEEILKYLSENEDVLRDAIEKIIITCPPLHVPHLQRK